MNFILSVLLSSGLTINTCNVEVLKEHENPQTKSIAIQEEYLDNDEISLQSYFKDQYEPNNSISTATEICPSNFYSQNSYTISLDATLDYTISCQDIDYYYLTIFTDSNVNIEIAADTAYPGNFEFSLMKYNYYSISNGYAYHYPEDVVSNYEGVRTISYTSTLKPGTYLIYLRGHQNSSITNDLPYSLNVSVSKLLQPVNKILVSNLKNDENVLGAVWISNFLPCDNTSTFDITSEYVYYKKSVQDLYYPDYTLDKLREISNGQPIKLATYYIWDKVLKYILYNAFITTKTYYLEYLEGQYNEAIKLRIQQNKITSEVEIVANVLGNDLVPAPISVPVSIISEIGMFAIEKYYNAIIPEFNMNQVDFAVYLTELASYFDLRLEGKPHSTKEEIEQYGLDGIVEVPIYYNLGINENIAPAYSEYYYSLKASSTVCSRLDTLNYSDEYFYSTLSSDYYCGGNIYKITNYNDLSDCSTLQLAQPHIHNYNDHYCTICNNYTTSHDYHEPYTWVDYTQHKATCGCKAIINQGHAVASNAFANGKKYAPCLICGGLAERGFVQLNALSTEVQYVTDNGSYILPNGVIVLEDEDIELYLNGTLEFHKKDSQLLTE